MWKSNDAAQLREAIGEMRLHYGPKWGYFELARYLPNWMPYLVVAKAAEGECDLAQAEEDAIRQAVSKIVDKRD